MQQFSVKKRGKSFHVRVQFFNPLATMHPEGRVNPPKKFIPPPIFIPPQYLYPPRLIGRFAKICTPFSPAQGNTTRTNPGYNLNTTAMVTHLKKAVIVVCFLTLETLLEAWATATARVVQNRILNLNIPCRQHKTELNDKRQRPRRTSPPKFIPPWPYWAFCRNLYPGVYIWGGGV